VSKDNPFSLEGLTATADLIANQRKVGTGPKPKRPRLDGQFIRVPFKAIEGFSPQDRVMLRLLYLVWWHRSQTVLLPNKGLAGWGVSRQQKHKALRKLERAGRIAVEWRQRKSPRVTLLD
jgi:hypothetical protein